LFYFEFRVILVGVRYYMQTRVSVKGQIVIPAPLRHKYGIKKGMKVHFLEEDGKIILEPVNDRLLRSLRGILKGTGALEELMAERALDREREDAKFSPRVR
jgi:AbrB family looped-hinge helix DNA binding protein